MFNRLANGLPQPRRSKEERDEEDDVGRNESDATEMEEGHVGQDKVMAGK